MRRRRTYVVVGLVTAITSMAVGIGSDNSGESQKNQSDLEFKIISCTFPLSFNLNVNERQLFCERILSRYPRFTFSLLREKVES